MEYIKEININEAVLHILDNNTDSPVLNEYRLELGEDTYRFLLKHIERCLRDEELKYAVFNEERNIIKEVSQEYLTGHSDIVTISKEMARQMFILMKSNSNVPSSDLVIVSFSTEYGPMLGIIKMDYVKNFTHSISFVDDKIDISIIPQATGLPVSSQRIQKCAFIKPLSGGQDFDLMVIDKQNKGKESDDGSYGTNYFISKYLGCSVISNERDKTKTLLKAVEEWTRNNLSDDAAAAETVRSTIKKKLKEETSIDVPSLSKELLPDMDSASQHFNEYITTQGVDGNFDVDKEWVEKKLKRVRLKIDRDIDLYINHDAYNDERRFEIQKNGDGSINIVIKHVLNYLEK
jgi:nucleoid-associated protein YejK